MATYKEIRQMWSDIGMDLDKHDEFLQSFPSVFKNIILSQKDRPGNILNVNEFVYHLIMNLLASRDHELVYHLGSNDHELVYH